MTNILIISQLQDQSALLLVHTLRQQGRVAVEHVTDIDLIAADWHVSLTTTASEWRLVLTDGRVLSSATVDVVYSRLLHLRSTPFRSEVDTAYAQSEWHALLSGWLRHLGSSLAGALSPTTLANGSPNALLRLYELAQAGLPVPDLSASTTAARAVGQAEPHVGHWQQEPLIAQSGSALALGPQRVGLLAGLFDEAIGQLQTNLGCDLLQVYFMRTEQGHWKATDYQTLVEPHSPDELLALADYVTNRPRLARPRVPIAHPPTPNHALV